MSYFRESFEYQPIKLFLNSATADTTKNRGDLVFNLRRNITLPSGTIGYVSLNELTIPNTNYNINTSNNTLVLVDSSMVVTTFEVTPGNYTVTSLMTELNSKFNPLNLTDQTVKITYNDTTNKCTFTHPTSLFLIIMPTSTMNTVLGFESGEIYTTVFENIQGSTLTTNLNKGSFTIIAGTSDQLAVLAYDQAVHTVITLTAGAVRTGANVVADINAKFIASGVPITATYVNQRITFTNTTINYPFEFLYPESTCLDALGFQLANRTSTLITAPVNSCSFTSSKIVDLSGNNSFYLTTNLGLGNYSFLSSGNTGGANVLAKIQLTTDNTGIEFYNNLTSFKSRFYDTNITQLHIVLYDENFVPWIPLSDWSCVIEMTFYEKYDLTTKLKRNDLLFSS